METRKDFNTPLLNIAGKQMKEGQKDGNGVETEIPLTVKNPIIVALLERLPNEPALSTEKNLYHFSLALKIQSGGEVELTPEDIVEIKTAVEKFYSNSPLIVGRIFEFLI